MEMVLLSDIHLGRYKYGKMNSEGFDYRTQDILDNIQQAFDYAFENNIKTIMILGDFYHTKRPPQVFRRLLSSKFNSALSKGVKLYLLLGNHDQGKTHGHDLVEFLELSSQIENLFVIEKETVLEIEDSVCCFMPHVNPFDLNIDTKNFFPYVLDSVRELSRKAKQSQQKFKYFFGHYATDKSIAGKSFDIGMDHKCSRVLPLNIFEKEVWTGVYLGDIHKPQEMNSFCKHVGSIARVDFGEEDEKKGFYHVTDDKDKFVEIKDRDLKTLTAVLTEDPRKQMGEFCTSIEDLDLSQSIVRLKIVIKEVDKELVSFSGLEQFLRETCWNYVGKSIELIKEDKKDIKIEKNEDVNYLTLFRNYVEQLQPDLKDKVIQKGEEILFEILNSKKD